MGKLDELLMEAEKKSYIDSILANFESESNFSEIEDTVVELLTNHQKVREIINLELTCH